MLDPAPSWLRAWRRSAWSTWAISTATWSARSAAGIAGSGDWGEAVAVKADEVNGGEVPSGGGWQEWGPVGLVAQIRRLIFLQDARGQHRRTVEGGRRMGRMPGIPVLLFETAADHSSSQEQQGFALTPVGDDNSHISPPAAHDSTAQQQPCLDQTSPTIPPTETPVAT